MIAKRLKKTKKWFPSPRTQERSPWTINDFHSKSHHKHAYGRKTVRAFCFFFEYCSLSWGWGGVGWGGMLTFLVLRTWYIAMLLRSLGSFTTLRVATLLRFLGSFTTWHVATLLRSLWSFTTLQVATRLVSPRSFTTLHVATLLRSLWPFTTLHVAALRMGLGAVVMHRFSVCRQRQGRTKMSCYTCVAGSGVMSAIMATCCRRQLPHWWIAEPTKSVKKKSAHPRLMHMMFTWIC